MNKQERNDNNYFIYLMAVQSAIRQRISLHNVKIKDGWALLGENQKKNRRNRCFS